MLQIKRIQVAVEAGFNATQAVLANTHTLVLRSPDSTDTAILVLGDSGTLGGKHTYADVVKFLPKISALVSAGDFSYSNGFAR